MKGIGKYVLIALIALAVGAFVTSKFVDQREPEITIVTEYDTIVKTEIKESPIEFIDRWHKAKPVTINVPDGTTLEPTDSVSVQTTKYVGTKKLPNGTIDYEIYADSLRATKFRLTTKDTTINTITTITKVLPPKSKLYVTGGLDVPIASPIPQSLSAGLMYIRRQKWGVGIEVRHDFSGLLPPTKSTTIGLRVIIPL